MVIVHGLASELTGRLRNQVSVPDRVADALRERILHGQLAPGERVVEGKLSRLLRVGQPTVREALKTLETEGLIVRQVNRGCSVTKLSAQEIKQMFRLRVEWEV